MFLTPLSTPHQHRRSVPCQVRLHLALLGAGFSSRLHLPSCALLAAYLPLQVAELLQSACVKPADLRGSMQRPRSAHRIYRRRQQGIMLWYMLVTAYPSRVSLRVSSLRRRWLCPCRRRCTTCFGHVRGLVGLKYVVQSACDSCRASATSLVHNRGLCSLYACVSFSQRGRG